MTESRSLTIHLALFDSAYHNAEGLHWTWHSPSLSTELLTQFYYDVILEPISQHLELNPAKVIRQGTSSIGQDWCCWFRVLDGGRDLRGRPGRYLMPLIFAQRIRVASLDLSAMFGHPVFQQIEDVAFTSPPLPAPHELIQQFSLGPTAVPADILEKLRVTPNQFGLGLPEARAMAIACSSSEDVETWKQIEYVSPSQANVSVGFVGASALEHPPALDKSPYFDEEETKPPSLPVSTEPRLEPPARRSTPLGVLLKQVYRCLAWFLPFRAPRRKLLESVPSPPNSQTDGNVSPASLESCPSSPTAELSAPGIPKESVALSQLKSREEYRSRKKSNDAEEH